jgi:ubiquinone/menaquinone biosynthesis C-methylase UbiE
MEKGVTMDDYRSTTETYYREQAEKCGLEGTSTMPDEVVRTRELQAIFACLDRIAEPEDCLLEIGCGNGLLLTHLAARYPGLQLTGVDYTPAMVDLARSRALPAARIERGDITRLQFESASFDLMVSERVIINVLSREDQAKAFAEAFRMLKPGGHFICIEGFANPLRQLNEARIEFCLPPIPMPTVNRWFEDEDFADYIKEKFDVISASDLPPPNFLSSHYFITRVFHDAIRPTEGKLRNTHFARFFADALPPIGDYAPVKLFLLRRRG